MKQVGGARGVKRASAASACERTGGALGFEAFRASDEFASPVYAGSEEQLKLPFRALLTKKDPVTKLKALADLEQALRTLDAEVCRDSLPHWAYLYERCQKDNDRRVRLNTARIMSVLVERFPKAMSERRFEYFAPDWLCSCFDPETECASLAKQILDIARPADYPSSILRKLCKYVRQRSPDESFDDFVGSPEEMQDRSHRVRSQALRAIAFIITQKQEGLDLTDLNDNSNWFKYLVAPDADGGAIVRRGAYQLLSALGRSQSYHEILFATPVTKSILRIPSEKDRAATPAMWDALLSVCENGQFLNSQPMETLRKGFFPELFRHLERRANDAGFSALSNLVVFLSILPGSVWDSYGNLEFCKEWFDRLLIGTNAEDDLAVVSSALECVNYLMKRKPKVAEDDQVVSYLRTSVTEKLLEITLSKMDEPSSGTSSKQEIIQGVVTSLLSIMMIPKMRLDLGEALLQQQTKIENVAVFLNASLHSKVALNPEFDSVYGDFFRGALSRLVQNGLKESACIELFDLRPSMFNSQDWIKEQIEFLSSSNALDSYPVFIARLVNKMPNQLTKVCESMLACAESETKDELIMRFVVNLDLSNSTTEKESVSSLLHIVDDSKLDGENEQLVMKWGNTELIQRRLDRFSIRLTALLGDPVEFSQQDDSLVQRELESLFLSFKALENNKSVHADNRRLVDLLLVFNGQQQLIQSLSGDDQQQIGEWLVGFPSTISRQMEQLWVNAIMSLRIRLPRLPDPDLTCSLLHSFGSEAFAMLPQVDNKSELIWWVLENQTKSATELRFKNHGEDQQADNIKALDITRMDLLNYIVDRFGEEDFWGDENKKSRALDQVVNGLSSIETSLEDVQALIESALNRNGWFCSSILVAKILQKLTTLDEDLTSPTSSFQRIIRDHFHSNVNDLISTIASDAAAESESNEDSTTKTREDDSISDTVKEQQDEADPNSLLDVGDTVQYTKTDGQTFVATLVGRHDEAMDPYYTIRYWHENWSKETQTTRDRLKLISSSKYKSVQSQLSDEERQKKLLEVQRLLQVARQTGNRADSIRLMKLQQELTPKPKDSEEERQKIEAARQKAEREWKEKRKAQNKYGEVGNEDEDEDGVNVSSIGQEWSLRSVSALKRIAGMKWRMDLDSFKLDEDEKSLLNKVVRSLTQMQQPSSGNNNHILMLIAMVVLMAPPTSIDFTLFVSRLVSNLVREKQYPPHVDLVSSIVDSCTKLVSESSAGHYLTRFLDSSSSTMPQRKRSQMAHSLVKLRFASRSIWNASNQLTSIMVQSTDLDSALAAFILLFRHPEIIQPGEATTSSSSQSRTATTPTVSSEGEAGGGDDQSVIMDEIAMAVNESTTMTDDEPQIAYAKSLFPSYLVSIAEGMFPQEDLEEANDNWDTANKMLVWMLMIRYVTLAWKSPSSNKARQAIGIWLRQDGFIFRVLESISTELVISEDTHPLLTTKQKQLVDNGEDDEESDGAFVRFLLMSSDSNHLTHRLASRSFFQTVHALPALVREWWVDHLPNRFDKEGVSRFTSMLVTPNVLRLDLEELKDAVANGAWDPSELSIRPSLATRKVVISTMKDDVSLDVEISFPDAYPLSPPNVECVKQIGVKQERWKRWALQIVQLLTRRDGTLSDAVQLWKQNLDKEFEGVEPCPICYSVLHAVDSSMPRIKCRTCKNTFHGKCLSQWFASSHQSLCPLCKQSFMASSSGNHQ